MFRMLKLKPPNGWNAVAWELGIVTIGVLMALGLQQWAENLASRSKAERALDAIRHELRENYLNAVEWRTYSPCVTGQLEQIEDHFARSGASLQPIPLQRMGKIRAAVMAPRRIYNDKSWIGTINGGIALQLTDVERNTLGNAYWATGQMDEIGERLVEADEGLLAATRPIEMDAQTRLLLLQAIDQIHAANEKMDRYAAEIIYWVGEFDAAPSRDDVKVDSAKYGKVMRDFCSSRNLPIRKLEDALDPNS